MVASLPIPSSAPDRGKQALQRLIQLLLPALSAFVPWEYQVLSATPGPPVTLDLFPVGSGNPFGPLSGVTLWAGPDGGLAVPAPNSTVLVRFNNGDPTKPAVCGLDPSTAPTIVYQYGTLVQIGTAAAAPLVLALPYAGLLAALETMAATMTAAITPPPVTLPDVVAAVIAIGGAGTALGTAIAALPPPATVNAYGS